MQLPKLRGFKSKRTPAENIYTGQLDDLKKAVVDTADLAELGLISNRNVSVKLITNGELKSKKTVKVQSASASAIAAVEAAGGKVELVERVARIGKKSEKS